MIKLLLLNKQEMRNGFFRKMKSMRHVKVITYTYLLRFNPANARIFDNMSLDNS